LIFKQEFLIKKKRKFKNKNKMKLTVLLAIVSTSQALNTVGKSKLQLA
jgi:hypothetical protein